ACASFERPCCARTAAMRFAARAARSWAARRSSSTTRKCRAKAPASCAATSARAGSTGRRCCGSACARARVAARDRAPCASTASSRERAGDARPRTRLLTRCPRAQQTRTVSRKSRELPRSSTHPSAGLWFYTGPGVMSSNTAGSGKVMGAKLRVAGWIALGTVAGALATMQLQAIARSSVSALPLEELQQLAAVFGMVKNNYVEPVDKKSFKEFKESTTGKFVGVGIEIGMEEGLVKVATPIEGSPAFRAGIKSGDLITKIDDTPVKGLTMDQAVKRMRGEPNTKVELIVFRKSESRTFPLTIMREEIRVQSVRAKLVEPGY